MKSFIKKHQEIIYGALFSLMLTFLFFATITANAQEPRLEGKCIVVDKKVKQQPVKTGYTIKVGNVVYDIYKGPKGGLYYVKNGKKVYLTKKQAALIK